MTSILNGTRFIYIEPIPDGKSLPKFNIFAGLRCKILHFGQSKNNHILRYSNFWKADQTQSTLEKWFLLKSVSFLGPKRTPRYDHEIQKHITPFSGSQEVLSFRHANKTSTGSNINPLNNKYICRISIVLLKGKKINRTKI